jgi:hypothetical protein
MGAPLWLQGRTIKTASDGFEAEAGQPPAGRRKTRQGASDAVQGQVGRAALAAWRANEAYVHPEAGVEEMARILHEVWRQADPVPSMLRRLADLDFSPPIPGFSCTRSQWYAVAKWVLENSDRLGRPSEKEAKSVTPCKTWGCKRA